MMIQGKQESGDQKVKYLKRQQQTVNNGGEHHANNDDHSHSNSPQLEILYRARGRKIEELSLQLEEKEEEFGKQIRMLNHQLALTRGVI